MPVADVLSAVEDHINRAPDYDMYRDYERGEHRHPYLSDWFKQKHANKLGKENMCPAVLSNYADRVQLAAWSGAGAKAATDLAETLGLSRILNLTVREAFRSGDAYILVWPNSRGDLIPRYHRADTVAYRASDDDPDEFDWVAKLWVDGKHGRVTVYYPDRIERWVTASEVRADRKSKVSWPTDEAGFLPFSDDDGEAEIRYGTARVPDFGMVPWAHIPFEADEQGGHGRSLLRDVIPKQDKLNSEESALILNTENYAEPMRVLMNHRNSTALDPNTGKPVENKVDIDPSRKRTYAFEGAGPFQQFDPANSTHILAVKNETKAALAHVAGIPVSDIAPDLGNIPSGVSLRVLASRRTAALRDFNDSSTPAVSRVVALLGVPDAYPVWTDPAPEDESEQWEIAEVRDRLGFPLGENLRDMGRDQEDIDRVLEARGNEEAAVGRSARLAYEQGRA